MKLHYMLSGLLVLAGMPSLCKADDGYSFFVKMPQNFEAYDTWLAFSNTGRSLQSESTSLQSGRIAVKSEGVALESRICTRSISSSTSLRATKAGLMLLFK